MRAPLACLALCLAAAPARAADWVALGPPAFLKFGDWYATDAATLDAQNPKRLAGGKRDAGLPVLVNGATGRTVDLITREHYGDCEVEFEFLVARGSNSGVKFNGQYEIQIIDKPAGAKRTGDWTGGVYPRAELKPRYRYLDEGTAPLADAARPAGEWQRLRAAFRAPRFGPDGKKSANARLDIVELNGTVVQRDLELKSPTGHAWVNAEKPRGPLLFQGDHGPVALRNLRVRPLD